MNPELTEDKFAQLRKRYQECDCKGSVAEPWRLCEDCEYYRDLIDKMYFQDAWTTYEIDEEQNVS